MESKASVPANLQRHTHSIPNLMEVFVDHLLEILIQDLLLFWLDSQGMDNLVFIVA